MDIGQYLFRVGLDDSQFTKGMTDVDKKLSSFGKQATKIGSSLTKKLTLPITALGVGALKMAADFEVASRKFAGAFSGAENQASSAVENLNKNFGLATSQATSLLAFTGDLLKGFGATSEQALDLANNTNELAAALAAYNGVPVARASEAVTKALLGERESLKLLGVAIREADVEQELLKQGKSDLTGQALLLAKAEATLTLAYKQSADAVGNFANNTDTLSFQSQKLLADLQDLGVQIGTILMPFVKDLVEDIQGLVSRFSELDEQTIKYIIGLGGIIAIAGPVIGAIGGISTALAFLAANPVVAAIGGVAALVGVVAGLVKQSKEKHVEELAEQFGDLAQATGVADEEMEGFAKAAEAVEMALGHGQYAQTLEEASYQVEQLTQNTGLTVEQITEIGLQSEHLNDNFKGMLKTIQETEKADTALLKAELDRAVAISGTSETVKEITEQRQEQAALTTQQADEEAKITSEIEAQKLARETALKLVIDARKAALNTYNKEVRAAQTQYNLGLINEEELLQANISASEKHAEALITAGYDGADASSTGNRELQRQVELLQENKAEADRLSEAEKERLKIIEAQKQAAETKAQIEKESSERWFNLQASEMDLLDSRYQQEIKQAKEVGADVADIEAYYAEQKAQLQEQQRQAEIEAEREKYLQIAKLANQYVGTVGGIFENLYQTQVNLIDRETQEKIESLKKQGLSQEEYAEEVKRIEREAANKKYDYEYKAFKTKQKFDIAETILNTATSVMKAYAQLGPIFGTAWAIALVALGATQIATIVSQPAPARPQLAEGGIVNPRAGGVPVTIGEAGDSEAVIPLNDRFFNRLSEAATGANTGSVGTSNSNSSPVIIQNVLDSKIISESVVGRINNNSPGTQIKRTSIVNM